MSVAINELSSPTKGGVVTDTDKLEQIVLDLKVEQVKQAGQISNVQQWVGVLQKDVSVIEKSIDRLSEETKVLSSKVDASTQKQLEMVEQVKQVAKEAGERPPKWAIAMLATLGGLLLTAAGWLVETIIFHK